MKFLLFLVAIMSLISCRSVKKITDTKKETFEIVEESNSDSSGVKTEKTETITHTNKDDSTQIEIVFEHDATDSVKAEDYVHIDTSGNITVKGKIKSATVKKKSNTQIVDTTKTEKKDTASISVDKKKTEKATVEEKHSTTERKGIFAVAFWPLFLGALLFLFIYFFIKRKKEKAKEILP